MICPWPSSLHSHILTPLPPDTFLCTSLLQLPPSLTRFQSHSPPDCFSKTHHKPWILLSQDLWLVHLVSMTLIWYFTCPSGQRAHYIAKKVQQWVCAHWIHWSDLVPPPSWSCWFDGRMEWRLQDSVIVPGWWLYLAGLGQDSPEGCMCSRSTSNIWHTFSHIHNSWVQESRNINGSGTSQHDP